MIDFEPLKSAAREVTEQAFKYDREAFLANGEQPKPKAETALGQLQDLLSDLQIDVANLQLDVEDDEL